MFSFTQAFYSICLSIDTALSSLIYGVFTVLMSLAQVRIFSSEVIGSLTQRAYVVISVVMLFVLVYSILKMIINPDELTKGKSSGLNVIKHVIIAIIVITFTPTIFDFSYGLQNSILTNNVIGKTIIGSDTEASGEAAGEFAVSVFTASFYLGENPREDVEEEYYDDLTAAKATGDISSFSSLIPYIETKEIVYHNLISLILNAVAVYVIVTFCFDMAIRVVKLAFLQIIAPIPAIMYMIPNNDSGLGKWIKECLASFFQVFVRIAILYITIFLFAVFNKELNDGLLLRINPEDYLQKRLMGPVVYSITRYFIIFGLLAFLKQAPKLFCDILGIKQDSNLFNLKQRVKDSIGTVYNPAKKAVVGAGHGVSKVAGAAGGIAFARKAYNESKKPGDKAHPLRSALSTFNGARIGFKGGIRSMGSAYKYEQLMQQSYAIQDQEGLSDKQIVARAIGDRTRKFIGRESRYDEKLMQLSIERDLKTAGYKKSIENINNQVGQQINDIEKQHKDTIDANKKTQEYATAVDSAAEENVSKKDSGYKVSFSGKDGMYEVYEKQLQDDLEKENRKTGKDRNQVKIDQLNRKLSDLKKLKASNTVMSASELSIEGMDVESYKNNIQREYNRLNNTFSQGNLDAEGMTKMTELKNKIDTINKLEQNGALKDGNEFIKYREDLENKMKVAREQGNTNELKRLQTEYSELSGFNAKASSYSQLFDDTKELNWYEIENRMKQLEKSDMDADLKSALVGMYSEAQKKLKTQYLTDEQNWDTKTKMAVSNFKTHVNGDADCGYKVDKAGNRIKTDDTDFKEILKSKSFGEAVNKIKKESSNLVNEETIIKNEQLVEKPVHIEIYNEVTGQMEDQFKTLYEFKDISENFSQKVKDENLIVEKYKESHETELNAQNTQKAAGDVYKNTKRVHIAHHKNNGKQ